MAVKIRLRRTGARNSPSFRVVATDRRFPRDGRFLENLGWYDPKRAGVNFDLNIERVEHWLDHGAMISDTVKSLLKKARTGEKAEANQPPSLVEERRPEGAQESAAADVPAEAAAVPAEPKADEPTEAQEPAAAEASAEAAEPVAEEQPTASETAEPEPVEKAVAEEKAE